MARLQRLTPATLALLFGLVLVPGIAGAHSTGENYVWLNVEPAHIEGRFEIRARDLERRFGIELPADADAARARLEASSSRVQRYLLENFAISVRGEPVPLQFTRTDLMETEGDLGAFAQYFYRTPELEVPDEIGVRNTVLLDTDRFHRSLLCIQYDRRKGREFGDEFTALVFASSNSEQTLDLTNVRGLLRVRDFVWQGMLHIWIGIDHVLFLIALLLTAVLVLKPGALSKERGLGGREPAARAAWQPVSSFKEALWNVFKIVTLFTVAHSITLSLAALDIVRLPGRFVESAIALSIVLIALNNLFPTMRKGWVVIFFFGLFHGLGFASVMGDLPFRMPNLVKVILAFNIGVEIGQLAIVLAAFPIVFWLRESRIYRPAVLVGGSIIICIVASYWFVTRALGVA